MAHGDAREGKWRGNWRMEWVASTLTLPRNTVYPALLPLIRTPRLPVVDWTDVPADLNGIVRFAERPNLVSARVPSHFKRSLPLTKDGRCMDPDCWPRWSWNCWSCRCWFCWYVGCAGQALLFGKQVITVRTYSLNYCALNFVLFYLSAWRRQTSDVFILHSCSILSDDRFKASSKTISPHSVI